MQLTGRSGRKSLGLWMSTALVVGNMIGSGVFLLPASLAAYGGISILGWLMTSLGALVLAFVFARLGRGLPKIGGPYAYSREGFGEVIGFQVPWGYWITIWVGIVQVVTTIGKLLPRVAIAAIGLFFFDAANFAPFNLSQESNSSAVTSTAALTLWAYIGIESATVPADDVENPTRTIPLSTIIGTIAATSVYVLGTVAVMSVIPPEALAQSTEPLADAAAAMFGPAAGTIVAIGALISTFACLNLAGSNDLGQAKRSSRSGGGIDADQGRINDPHYAVTWRCDALVHYTARG